MTHRVACDPPRSHQCLSSPTSVGAAGIDADTPRALIASPRRLSIGLGPQSESVTKLQRASRDKSPQRPMTEVSRPCPSCKHCIEFWRTTTAASSAKFPPVREFIRAFNEAENATGKTSAVMMRPFRAAIERLRQNMVRATSLG